MVTIVRHRVVMVPEWVRAMDRRSVFRTVRERVSEQSKAIGVSDGVLRIDSTALCDAWLVRRLSIQLTEEEVCDMLPK